jgi:hypothetical protein
VKLWNARDRDIQISERRPWHSLKHITLKTRDPIEDLSDYCTILPEHEIFEYAADSGRVRIERELTNMIVALDVHGQIMEKWRRTGARTVIFPPRKGFQIQGVSIQSITE